MIHRSIFCTAQPAPTLAAVPIPPGFAGVPAERDNLSRRKGRRRTRLKNWLLQSRRVLRLHRADVRFTPISPPQSYLFSFVLPCELLTTTCFPIRAQANWFLLSRDAGCSNTTSPIGIGRTEAFSRHASLLLPEEGKSAMDYGGKSTRHHKPCQIGLGVNKWPSEEVHGCGPHWVTHTHTPLLAKFGILCYI